jgi:putative flavoprotein involved in K+ transport
MTDPTTAPTRAAATWLADFAAALARGDVDAAVALFEPDSYWRDLVAFTWNIRTQEGPDAIRAMLKARLPRPGPCCACAKAAAGRCLPP